MSDKYFYIVMELVTGGELYQEIIDENKLSEQRSRRIFQQLVDAISFCHSKGIYHRDIKPENILIDDKDCVKVTDFGLSSIGGAASLLHTQCGTPKYMAPEVIMRSKQGYRGDMIDVWDCGMVLFVCLSGRLPFEG